VVSSAMIVQMGRELLFTAMVLALPTVLISLVVGLVISIFQTITSIQEQTLSFAPRILAVGIGLVLTLPWTLDLLIHFTTRMFLLIPEVTR
jgi:flagellar biosynthetic protein FliQ